VDGPARVSQLAHSAPRRGLEAPQAACLVASPDPTGRYKTIDLTARLSRKTALIAAIRIRQHGLWGFPDAPTGCGPVCV
jgi:hypothetical protein